MIDSISSASFISYGSQNRPQGNRHSSDGKAEHDAQSSTNSGGLNKKEEENKYDNPQKLDEAEKKQVEDLKKRDAEVRTHEQAHMAAAGSLAMGGPNYVFQTGPDGRQYAIGGDVKIDTSPGNTPEETARKARQIRAAALAPADPSAQDLKVAASAASMEIEAATKNGDKSEKDSKRAQAYGEGSSEDSAGEITSVRQLSPASPPDSGNSERGDHEPKSGQNGYLLQAAKLYQSSVSGH